MGEEGLESEASDAVVGSMPRIGSRYDVSCPT